MYPAALHRLSLSVLLAASLAAGACAPAVVAGGAGASTAGTVALQERSASEAVSDVQIRLEINHYWFQASEILYRKVNLQVQEGRVLLTGAVPDPQTRVDAVRLAWQATGVREVINEIEVDDQTTLTDMTRDTVISRKLKNRLLADKEISSLNYSIEVVNQHIFLIGIAQDQAELDRVMSHAKDISYVRRLTNYVRLKDNPLPERQES